MYKFIISFLLTVILLNSCKKTNIESPSIVKKVNCVLLNQETLFNGIITKYINQYDSYLNLQKSETIISNKTTSTTTVKNVLNIKNRPTISVYKNEKDITLKTVTTEYTDNINVKKQTIEYSAGNSKISEMYEYNLAGKLIHFVTKNLTATNDVEINSSFNKSNLLIREETLKNKVRSKLIENTYDEKDNLLKSITTLTNSKSFIEYFYNDKAQLIKTNTELGVITDFKYTDQMVESISKLNNKIIKTERREFDINGNLIKVSTSTDGIKFLVLEEREYFPDNKLLKRTTRTLKQGSTTETVKFLEVTYDNNGNFIKYLNFSPITGELVITETYAYACN